LNKQYVHSHVDPSALCVWDVLCVVLGERLSVYELLRRLLQLSNNAPMQHDIIGRVTTSHKNE
jgi:hypothetical protein